MSSITFDSNDEIRVMSSSVPAATSIVCSSHLADRLTGNSSNIYTVERLKRMLLVQAPKIRLVPNHSSKLLVPWWRSFGYVAIKNENNEFERANSFIRCLKCYHTVRYGSASGTKHFMKHANRCFPLTSKDHSTDDIHDHKLVQHKSNQVGI